MAQSWLSISCASSTVPLSYDQSELFLSSLFRIYFANFPVVKVAPVLGATLHLVQALLIPPSGGINPRPERRRNGKGWRASMISVKQIIVESTTPPILLHCDIIGNIQPTPIRNPNRQSHLLACRQYLPSAWILRETPWTTLLGGGGDTAPQFKILGTSPRNRYFYRSFLQNLPKIFDFWRVQNKVTEIRGKMIIWG